MILKKDKQRTVSETIGLKCDRCNSVETFYELGDVDIASFKHSFGWLSQRDGDEVSFELCEKCLMDILESQKIDYRIKRNF